MFWVSFVFIFSQARRHVIKSGPAEIRSSAEGRSGGEHERGNPLS